MASRSQAKPFLAIDPGPTESAYVAFERGNPGKLLRFGIVPNQHLRNAIAGREFGDCDHLAIEMVASYGMAVGAPVFETCVWIGRFIEAWGHDYSYLYRAEIKHHLCHSRAAQGANVRRALIDRWGGIDKQVIGTKKKPGPLYGVSTDVWAALAVAAAYSDGVRSELKVGIE